MNARCTAPLVVVMTDAAHRRIESRLRTPGRHAELVLMRDNKTLARAQQSQPITAAEAQPSIVWAGSETFMDGRFRSLFNAALQSPATKWFQSGAAGTDNPLFAQLIGRGIRLTSCHAPAEAVADYVLAGALDHYQRGPDRRQARQRHEWMPLPFTEIGALRWLILGFGAIGQSVARRAAAFGADITAVQRQGGSSPHAQRVVLPSALATFLPLADVVVLSLPLNTNTEQLVDEGFLAQLKPGSLLVNVSRGRVVDEAALAAGLNRGQPGHAILDVCVAEPLPSDHLFWEDSRVTLTAHLAGMGSGVVGRSDELFLANIERYCEGYPLLHEVRQ